jgi:uncharacterized protein
MGSYDIIIYSDSETYTRTVKDFLEQQEAENGVFLSVVARLSDAPFGATPFMAQVKSGSVTVSAAIYREFNLFISRGPEGVWPIVAFKIKDIVTDIPGVAGPAVEAQLFATAWAQIRGCESYLAADQRLYRLTQVDRPIGIPGNARLVTENDVETLMQWIQEFYREAIPWEMPTFEQIRENAKNRIPLRLTFFWEVEGKPVAMAALARPSARGIAVNAVYTAPEQRRHGYASALVAAVSTEGLGRGKEFCILYTDLMNPTSNSIYQKIAGRGGGVSR